jgi:hypothetical protein
MPYCGSPAKLWPDLAQHPSRYLVFPKEGHMETAKQASTSNSLAVFWVNEYLNNLIWAWRAAYALLGLWEYYVATAVPSRVSHYFAASGTPGPINLR